MAEAVETGQVIVDLATGKRYDPMSPDERAENERRKLLSMELIELLEFLANNKRLAGTGGAGILRAGRSLCFAGAPAGGRVANDFREGMAAVKSVLDLCDQLIDQALPGGSIDRSDIIESLIAAAEDDARRYILFEGGGKIVCARLRARSLLSV